MVSSGYAIHRTLTTLVVLVGVSVLTFVFVHLTPGDAAATILRARSGRTPPDHVVQSFRRQHGLDEPLHVQYGDWLLEVLQGDLGTSYYSDRAVTELLLAHLPTTVELAVASILVALLVSIPVGVLSAVHQGEWIDMIGQLGALLGVSIPNFWLGYVLILVFSLGFGLFPVAGTGGLSHLVLPAVTLGSGMTAIITRVVRTSMLDVLDDEYVDVARSKGLRERVVIYKHALRNALVPVVTVVGLQFGFVMNGAVVVEVVFQRPGLGTLLVDSVFARDYPVVQGIVLVIAVLFVLTNLAVDLTYHYLDPRIRSQGVRA